MGLGGQCEEILVAATQMVSVIGPEMFLHSAEWVFDTKRGGTAGDSLSLDDMFMDRLFCTERRKL